MSKNVRRLYASFKPSTYELELDADRENMRLSGSVVITGQKAGRPSQRLTFHQKGLQVSRAEIIRHDKKGDRAIAVARINLQKSYDELRLHASELLYAGQYTITLHFSAPIQNSMHGVYVCNYEVNGKKQQMVATQFESHYARE